MTTANIPPEKVQFDAVSALALRLLRKVTGLGEHDLRESTTFESINLESLAITAFVSSLELHFSGLSKTFIFDCRNILDVTAYLIRQHPDDAKKLLGHEPPAIQPAPVQQTAQIALPQPTPGAVEDAEWPEIALSGHEEKDAIAIIGMHGHFPGAETLEEFWNNLYQGKNAVSEIPSDRWTLDKFFEEGTDSRRTGLSYAKWGGFIHDVDKFDAQFFGISSREAAQMDPQERIFLECAWHAMENAALFGERAENLKQGNNYNIGVFVGLTTNTYSLLASDHWRNGGTDVPAAVPWSAANRVSFALNLCGPSLAVDTACSSSLVALHLACESIAKGECKAAIAGGVNLYFHPAKYIQLCQLQMLSPTGRCYTFGKDGDGFVPGEGVGAIVLKRLSAAQADGDRIIGVIRGTSVNHCGRTNGYTVPNAQSQAQLIKTALDSFGLPPSSINYVEAHGTGTKLGDPIEFTALTETLDGRTSSIPCGIGSVKSNIGHLESAAGIAGIIKVLLQLKHQCITPSLGSAELNPALDMAGSRFFVPQTPMAWQPDPVTGVRRAGISSFGAGGTNGHAIVEQAPQYHRTFQPNAGMSLVFPVSARSREQLAVSLTELQGFIQSDQFNRQSDALYSLAYILQCGRKHHPFRFCTVANSREELLQNLGHYLQHAAADATKPVFVSHIRPDEETAMQGPSQDAATLAKLWSQGVSVIWHDLWSATPALMEIPQYPFAKDRHWISTGMEKMTMPGGAAQAEDSRPARQVFSFSGQEYFLRQHSIGGQPIFPAAAYFNYFHDVAKAHGLGGAIEFQNVSWVHPFRPTSEPASASFVCDVEHSSTELKLTFTSPDQQTIYCRGRCVQSGPALIVLNTSLQEIQSRCVTKVDAQACYPLFDSLDMVYGPAFRCMQAAWVSGDSNEALVEVCRDASVGEANNAVVCEPGMLDGIFQSSFVFSLINGTSAQHQFIPYSVKSLRLHQAVPERVLVHVKKRDRQSEGWNVFDFTVFAPTGERILEIEEFSFRKVARTTENTLSQADGHDIHLYQPLWVESALNAGGHVHDHAATVVFDPTKALYQALCLADPQLVPFLWLVVPGTQFVIRDNNVVELNLDDASHLDLLWRMFMAKGSLPENMIFNLASPVGSDPVNPAWEGAAGLGESKQIIEIMRSACEFVSSPRFHVQVNCPTHFGFAIAGFLRAVNAEIPTIGATVVMSSHAASKDAATDCLVQEFLGAAHPIRVQEVRWENGKRYMRRLSPASPYSQDSAVPALAANDVVVITGGAGAIARSLAERLAGTPGIRLALMGRTPENAAISAFLETLRSRNVLVQYWQTDCADRERLAETLVDIRKQFGPVSAVLHCAGTLKDAFFLRQDKADWDGILKAKVLGAIWLDALTQHDPLKWFVVCSGLAGVRGNIGQSTYGMANAWLNEFAEQRQETTHPGRTIAVAWSLWDTDSGMQPPKSMLERYAKKGLAPISRQEGVEIFQQILQRPSPVVIPVKGVAEGVAEFLGAVASQTPVDVDTAVAPTLQEDTLESTIIDYLAGHLSRVTSTPVSKIDPDVSLEAFGLDSILVMELNDALEKSFPQMSKTVLFEARNLRLLAKLLIAEYQADALKVAQSSAGYNKPAAPPKEAMAIALDVAEPAAVLATPLHNDGYSPNSKRSKGDNIAIVGIAGRYPGASNLHELWEHLSAGHDLVSEIPGRWTMQDDELKTKSVYAKWGGFVEDFDRFDPLFFGISPRDAERMDPQERLFLQTAWHTLEDAGYTPESLAGGRGDASLRRRVGVIVGVMYGEYQLYSADEHASDVITNSSYASIANRVSYCMDFDGPSFAIDSMCSSSLTSISLACDQLRAGRCDAVIAGGVNLSIHPHKYRMLCELNFASTDGRCRSFGDGGDGYVPGEGVGAVLLKRLEDAEKDGDHIYAVIQGSDIGHGAKTSGYTVPNADAQADVIHRAFERSGIAPSRLAYLEAHGTGTSLGDPIEIRGVTKALAPYFAANQQCPVGSIKSNIGHLESAAGIAALSKVVLQFQHEKLVPSIHSGTLNKNIDFSKTPFFVQRELADWKRHAHSPLVAAVSSFGAGGANAHIVLEEYHSTEYSSVVGDVREMFVFSARSYPQLNKMVRNFIAYLDREMLLSNEGVSHHVTRNKFTISDVAATLAEGRRHLRVRLAVTAKNFSQLHNTLNRYITLCGNDDPQLKQSALESQEIFYGDTEAQSTVQASRSALPNSIIASAQAWVQGGPQARGNIVARWRKVPLPGYEFLRNRYWFGEQQEEAKPVTDAIKVLPETVPKTDLMTPKAILDLVSRGEMARDEARNYLLAMSQAGQAVS